MPDWIYDPRLKGSGYRDAATGRLLSNETVRGMMQIQLDAGGDINKTLATMFVDGNINANTWQTAFRQEIKDQYITQYMAGRGGRETMTSADWGSVGGMIADQYRYLDGFVADIAENEYSEEYLANRMGMYINSSRESYERAFGRSSLERGDTEKWWVENEGAENCEDCDTLQAQEAIPIEDDFISPSTGEIAIPGNGATICLTNCQCHTEYGGRP